jgi:hypothetical protein
MSRAAAVALVATVARARCAAVDPLAGCGGGLFPAATVP